MTDTVDAGQIDLLDGQLYAGDPWSVYAWLRRNAPAYYDAQNQLWGISRHADIRAIELDPSVWSSARGYRPQLPSDPSMIGMDDPEHANRRRLVRRRFAPRGVAGYEPHARAAVVDMVDAALAAGSVDAVAALAAPLPAKMIGRLLGFPDDRWPELVRWSETTISAGGGLRYVTEDSVAAMMDFAGSVLELAAARREDPRDDLISVWSTTDPDKAVYDEVHLANEALLLLDGGAETTRTVIATGIDALIRHPEQWERLRHDPTLITPAVEEIIRWTSPVLNMCRTATKDTVVAGETIEAGQQVLLMYGSANRDESVFTEPERFDVTRRPGDHLAFGLGTHFCLGATLARLELRVFFEEFLARVGHASWADGQGPRIMPNSFVRGVTHFPITVEGR